MEKLVFCFCLVVASVTTYDYLQIASRNPTGTSYMKHIDISYPTTQYERTPFNNGQLIKSEVMPFGVRRRKDPTKTILSPFLPDSYIDAPFVEPYPDLDGHNAGHRIPAAGIARQQSMLTDIDTLPFNTLYKWKSIDFEFLSPGHRNQSLASGDYIPANVLPLGLETWGSRVWMTIPRWKRGVPATLATVPRAGGSNSIPLKPYPDWNFQQGDKETNKCSGLTSVFRISADTCGRLWVLDSGQIESLENPQQLCPPSIVVFDLKTDQFIAKYTIPATYVLQDSLFANVVVDTRLPDCSDLHLYISDTWRYGLLVFRESDQSFWRFSNPSFYPDPLSSNYTLHGVNFQWTDGIFGLALTPAHFSERFLFYHSISSAHEFYVSTAILRDRSRVNNSSNEFYLAGESRGPNGQSSASAIDRHGVMYYGLVSRDSVGCWNTRKTYRRSNLGTVVTNTQTLIFPNDLKIDQEESQSVWILSNRLPMFQAGPLNSEEYNYRILYADTVEAVQGTICDPFIDNRD